MTKTIRIEVTEGMLDAALTAIESVSEARIGRYATQRAALTAAFQHPEFVEQIRQQVLACVDEADFYWPGGVAHIHYEQARANIEGLLGVEG